MGDKTTIGWTDATWNPIRGCSRVSPGCQHCYAETVAGRFCGPGQAYEGLVKITAGGDRRWNGEVRMVPEHLGDPLRWRRPRRIFVNSMSDLFHEALTNEQIAAVFGVMAAAPQHTFQVLTKRAERMHAWFAWAGREFALRQRGITSAPHVFRAMLDAAFEELGKPHKPALDASWSAHEDDLWPLPNVWLGVSVEDQERTERIPWLLKTPARIRFLSCEPLLGELDIRQHFGPQSLSFSASGRGALARGIDWVIAGAESGRGARPCEVGWLRSLRDQCRAPYAVPFFLKQAVSPWPELHMDPTYWVHPSITPRRDLVEGPASKRKRGGLVELPYLDGHQHAEFP